MSRKVVLLQGASMVTGDLWKQAAKRDGFEYFTSQAKSPSEFLESLNGVEVIVNAGGAANFGGWTDQLVQSLPSTVKAVCHSGAGYDPLGNLDRFKAKGIQVSNTPDGVVQATADTGLYLILGVLRNFGRLERSLREGKFLGGIPLAEEYDGKTLGVLGLGGIGSVIRDKVDAALNFSKIQYYNRRRASPDVEKGATYVDLDTLLSTSDVILVGVPLNKGTYHLLSRENLAKAKKGCYIVNIARGPIIDEDALGDLLESGHIAGVGLDVYEKEPIINPKVLAHQNSLLLPHAGTHTTVARHKIESEVLDNVVSVLQTGKVLSLVPELQ